MGVGSGIATAHAALPVNPCVSISPASSTTAHHMAKSKGDEGGPKCGDGHVMCWRAQDRTQSSALARRIQKSPSHSHGEVPPQHRLDTKRYRPGTNPCGGSRARRQSLPAYARSVLPTTTQDRKLSRTRGCENGPGTSSRVVGQFAFYWVVWQMEQHSTSPVLLAYWGHDEPDVDIALQNPRSITRLASRTTRSRKGTVNWRAWAGARLGTIISPHSQ
jgi:hypothetical protein